MDLSKIARRLNAQIGESGPSSIRGRLVLMTVVLLIPALVVGALLLHDASTRERQAVETQLAETSRALSLGVDRQIGQDHALLDGLASSPFLAAGDFEAFDRQVRTVIPRDVWIAIRRPDSQTLVNTRFPMQAGAPLEPLRSLDLTWAYEAGPRRVSNVFVGSSTGKPQVVVSRDIMAKGPATLTLSRRADSLGAILTAQNLPPDWVGAILDRKGVIIARTRAAERYVGQPATSDFLGKMGQTSAGVLESRSLEGGRTLVAYSRAPESQWTVAVAMPWSQMTAAAERALSWAAFSGIALLAIGLLLAAWVADGVVRPIEALAAYATTLGSGDDKGLERSGLREADHVRVALARSERRLHRREEELRRLNATLEVRIAERTKELAETTETLIQAQKLEAVGRLTGGIAHDFNNLLTAVQGNLEMLGRRIVDDRLTKYVANARQAAERGAKLTAQLLAFSRRQRLEPAPTDINGAVGQATALLTSTLGGTIRVQHDLDAGLWPAMADATQLELIILNLAINARDAMPVGGVITIATRNAALDGPGAGPEAPPPGEYVALSVADTGAGMTPEVMARVFEPFFTTKEVGRGSGLGLPQVLGVAKQLGGGVGLSSTPGEGAVVTVYLPRAAETASQEPVQPSDLMLRALDGVRILLVDDDPDVRGVTLAMLEEAGCKVRTAMSGSAALKALEEDPLVDLVILDYAMPGLTGAQTAARVQQTWAGTPILLMSGYADADALAQAWSGPFLHKPFTASSLNARIGQALGSGKVVRLRKA